MQAQRFLTLGGLARQAGVSRYVPLRLLALDQLRPHGFLQDGDIPQPLFLPEQAVEVVRGARGERPAEAGAPRPL